MTLRFLRKIFRRIMRSIPVVRAPNYLWAQIDKTNPCFVGWGMPSCVSAVVCRKRRRFPRSFYETNETILALVRECSFQLAQLRSLTVDA